MISITCSNNGNHFYEMCFRETSRKPVIASFLQMKYYFCFLSHFRWVEDQAVADRLKKIWPHIIKMVTHWESLPKSSRPNSKSYDAVVKGVKDELTFAKLSFFSFIAGLLKPYLTKYQTDQPMIPFLAKDLEAMYKSLMRLILKTQSFDDCSGNDLLRVDLSNKSNYLKPKDIHLGFETAKVLQDLIVKSIITVPSAKAFRQECRQMIIDLLQKLLQKSPLSSPIVARSTAINPLCIFSSPKDTLRSKMKTLLHHLLSLKIITSTISERALAQYTEEVYPKVKEIGVFDPKKERLDKFYFHSANLLLSPEIKSIIKLILVSNHGQASVERGFNTNKSVNKVNISQDSIITRKLIIDHMQKKNLTPSKIELSASLIKSVKASRQRYSVYLDEQKKLKVKDNIDKQRDILNMELQEVNSKKDLLLNCCQSLDEEFVELIKKAEYDKDNITSLVIKANGIKRKCEEKKKEISSLEEAISTLNEKKRKLLN